MAGDLSIGLVHTLDLLSEEYDSLLMFERGTLSYLEDAAGTGRGEGAATLVALTGVEDETELD